MPNQAIGGGGNGRVQAHNYTERIAVRFSRVHRLIYDDTTYWYDAR
jgi:hypothetical protein